MNIYYTMLISSLEYISLLKLYYDKGYTIR